MSKSFFIDKTPPIPPPYCDIALILRTINLIFTRTQIPRCPPLGSFHEKFTRKIGLKKQKKKHYFYLQLIIAWLSRLTRATKTIFILFLQEILTIPDVLLAVHSSYTSRCPQTILKQKKKICIVMTPANHLN